MTFDNDVHFLVKAKKILRTNEYLPILNHFYYQKTQAFMDNNFDMVSGCWANVTPTDTKSIVENIKEIHENLNIFGYIDIHQYVLNLFLDYF